MTPRRWLQLGLGVALFLGGMWTGWGIGRPKPAPPERYAPEQRLEGGAVLLEKKPQADAKPAHQVPKGAKVERIVQVKVEPKPVTVPTLPDPVEVPPLTVDVSLLRMPDLTRRVEVSSPDGRILGGVDIPVEDAKVARVPKWAAGVVLGTTAWGDSARGVFLDRDVAFLRMGVELTRNTYAQPAYSRQAWEGRLKLGLRF